MDRRDGRKNIPLFLAGIFLVGMTLGSIMGLGATAEAEFTDDPDFRRYLAAAALTNLPFWGAVFLPQTFRHRLGFGSLALMVKGVLVGCSGVFLLSSAERGLYFYSLDILPQIFITVPMLLFAVSSLLEGEDRTYTYPSILTNIFLSILATFISSCVQYLVFLGFYTIQVAFVTNF